MTKIKNNYWAPSPIWARKIGDALLAASLTITTFAIVSDYKVIAITACIVGGLGKFLSNLFTITPSDIEQDKIVWEAKKKKVN